MYRTPFVKSSQDISTLKFELIRVNTSIEAKNVLLRYDDATKLRLFWDLYGKLKTQSYHLGLEGTITEMLGAQKRILNHNVYPTPYEQRFSRLSLSDIKQEKTEILHNEIWNLMVAENYLNEVKLHNDDVRAGNEFGFRLLPPDKI